MKVFLLAKYQKWDMGYHINSALEKLSHETKVFDYVQNPSSFVGKIPILKLPNIYPRLQKIGVGISDKKIREEIEKFNPDLVFVVKGESILPKTIEWIRNELGAFTVNWFPDDPHLFNSISSYIAPYYDYFFSSGGPGIIREYHDIGVDKVENILFACDSLVHKTIKISEKDKKLYECDVNFVGSCYPERVMWTDKILGHKLKIWGPNWKLHRALIKLFLSSGKNPTDFVKKLNTLIKTKVRRYCVGKGIYFEDMVKAYNAAKIVLNFHVTYGMRYSATNMRDFEVTGSGAFLLTDETEALKEAFKFGKEIAIFNTDDNLSEVVDYYLDNSEERKKIAKNGQRRAYKEYTYLHRVKKILSVVK